MGGVKSLTDTYLMTLEAYDLILYLHIYIFDGRAMAAFSINDVLDFSANLQINSESAEFF